jgi:hypothetical protein
VKAEHAHTVIDAFSALLRGANAALESAKPKRGPAADGSDLDELDVAGYGDGGSWENVYIEALTPGRKRAVASLGGVRGLSSSPRLPESCGFRRRRGRGTATAHALGFRVFAVV